MKVAGSEGAGCFLCWKNFKDFYKKSNKYY